MVVVIEVIEVIVVAVVAMVVAVVAAAVWLASRPRQGGHSLTPPTDLANLAAHPTSTQPPVPPLAALPAPRRPCPAASPPHSLKSRRRSEGHCPLDSNRR
ncbi:hypothetical protein E2C01_069622 [Portunus trituberculatus]|uniref:Uncharacterized protein n=1 Tax=Portunus trituberculatus TaxID=210409 RepID=A0A5B7I2T9_PORTR|nr:hypothetical protein [Portunus trituberculatus]